MKSTVTLLIAGILCLGGITNASAVEPNRDPCFLHPVVHRVHRVIHHIHHGIHRGLHEIHRHLPLP